MSKGYIITLSLYIILGLWACSKGFDIDIDDSNKYPVFMLDISIDGSPLSVSAGRNDFFMLTDYEELGDFVMKKGLISKYTHTPAQRAVYPSFSLSTMSQNKVSNDFFELIPGHYRPYTAQGRSKWLFDIRAEIKGKTSFFEPVYLIIDGYETILENTLNVKDLEEVTELSVTTIYQGHLMFYTVGNSTEGGDFSHLLRNKAVQFNGRNNSFSFELSDDFEWTDVIISLPDGQPVMFDESMSFTEPGQYVFVMYDSVSGSYVSNNFIIEEAEIRYIENSIFMNTTFMLRDKELYEKYFIFEYVDEAGMKYTSTYFSDNHYFNITDIVPFDNSPENTPTQKVSFEFDIPMTDSSKQQLFSVKGKGVFALPVSY